MIQLEQVAKSYTRGRQVFTALSDVNLDIQAGEVFGLIGHSGAGKSTLLRCINLLERPNSGRVVVDGKDLTQLSKRNLQSERQKIGMIFQHFHLLHSATVAENVAFPMRLANVHRREREERVSELLDLVGLAGYESKYPGQLSGGQKQRVAIARALANHPRVLLCDEATSALDPQTTTSILDLLTEINRRLGLTIVIVTHEMSVVQRVCDRVAILDEGRIVEMGNVTEIFLHPKHEMTRSLLEVGTDEESMEGVSTRPLRDTNHLRYEITFVGELTYTPLLAEVALEHGVTFSILRGMIDVLKDTPFGRLVVEWYGDELSTAAAIEQLRQRGCTVRALSNGGSVQPVPADRVEV